MAEPKTKKTTASVEAYLKKAAKGDRYEACKFIGAVMAKATKDKPAMWGPAIVGYGSAPIVYANGTSLDWPQAAYSARAEAIVIYGTRSSPKHAALMKKIGKAKMAGGCLYIKSLDGVDKQVLAELITSSVAGKKKAAKK